MLKPRKCHFHFMLSVQCACVLKTQNKGFQLPFYISVCWKFAKENSPSNHNNNDTYTCRLCETHKLTHGPVHALQTSFRWFTSLLPKHNGLCHDFNSITLPLSVCLTSAYTHTEHDVIPKTTRDYRRMKRRKNQNHEDGLRRVRNSGVAATTQIVDDFLFIAGT